MTSETPEPPPAIGVARRATGSSERRGIGTRRPRSRARRLERAGSVAQPGRAAAALRRRRSAQPPLRTRRRPPPRTRSSYDVGLPARSNRAAQRRRGRARDVRRASSRSRAPNTPARGSGTPVCCSWPERRSAPSRGLGLAVLEPELHSTRRRSARSRPTRARCRPPPARVPRTPASAVERAGSRRTRSRDDAPRSDAGRRASPRSRSSVSSSDERLCSPLSVERGHVAQRRSHRQRRASHPRAIPRAPDLEAEAVAGEVDVPRPGVRASPRSSMNS